MLHQRRIDFQPVPSQGRHAVWWNRDLAFTSNNRLFGHIRTVLSLFFFLNQGITLVSRVLAGAKLGLLSVVVVVESTAISSVVGSGTALVSIKTSSPSLSFCNSFCVFLDTSEGAFNVSIEAIMVSQK